MKMSRNWAAALVAAATALTGASAFGQVVSETCAGLDTSPANSIVVGTPVTGNFTGADHDGPTYTTCGTSTTAPNQWWLFIPPTTATYTISMCDSAQGDTILGIQPASDACTVGTSLACNDDACGLGSQIALSLTGGTAYRIRAAAFSTSLTNGGGYTILITQQSGSAPAGDDCASPITAADGNNAGTLVGATGSIASGGNSCGGTVDTNDVYFSYMATATGPHKFSVCTGDFDAVLSVHTACPVDGTTTNQIASACATSASPTVLQCGNRGAFLSVSLTNGTTYLIRVAGTSDQSTSSSVGAPFVGFGSFNLVISQPPPPPANDTCATAVDLTSALPYSASITNEGAFDDLDPGTCNTGTSAWGGVWFTYTAGGDGALTFTETNGQDIVWGVWNSATCDPAGAALLCTATDTAQSIAVVSGQTYKIQCSALASTTSRVTPLAVAFDFVAAPANDTCATAVDLTSALPYSATIANLAAGNDIDPGTCNTGTSAWGGVWFTYTAGANGVLTFTETNGQDIVWGAWNSATCDPAGAALLCTASDTGQSIAVVSGQTYKVQCSALASTTSRVTPLAVAFDFVAAPANDTCATAEEIMSLPASVSASGVAADDDSFDITCNSGTTFRKTVWYTVTPADSGSLAITQTSSNDTAVAVFTGSCGALAQVACSDPNAFVVSVTGGTQYWIGVGMWSTTTNPTVAYGLTLELISAPDNDACDTPTDLGTGTSGSVTPDGRAAFPDPDVTCNSGTATSAIAGVWYTWTAPAVDNGTIKISETSTNDVVLFAATGSCGAFTDVFCSDPETNITAPITPGTTYYFMVAMFSATAQPTVPYALTYTYTPATGQCCVGSSCTITTHSNCNTMSGTYGGDNISCNPPAGMPTNFGPGPSYTIVDNATGTSEITVGGTPFPLGAVSVSVDLTHTFQSDVILTLTNGSTTVSLHKGDGALVNNLGGTYVFTDTATQTLDSAAAGLLTADVLAPGNYKAADTGNVAVSLNDAFYNQTSVGTWTLSIGDDASLDTGAMSAWTLILDGQGASPCSAPCPGNHDGNGQVDADDLFAFLDDWFAQNGVCMSGCTANYIAPDAVDADDLFAYLDIWFANNGNICP